MRWAGLCRKGSRDVSNCAFEFSSACFLNDSSFHEIPSCGAHMAWQSAPSGIRLGTIWETRLRLTDTSMPWLIAPSWRDNTRAKEIRRVAFPKPHTEEFQDRCMEALQGASYETELTGCDKKNVREKKPGKFVTTSCWPRPCLQQKRWLGTSSAEVKCHLKGERDTRQMWMDAD